MNSNIEKELTLRLSKATEYPELKYVNIHFFGVDHHLHNIYKKQYLRTLRRTGSRGTECCLLSQVIN